ncbi:MAG: hypothetical protein GXY55_20065 [Phycisphaerae bacterium]|nr:hypothetical protein [Phycisphaerae bacterium]
MHQQSQASWNRRGGALKVLAIIFVVIALVCAGIGTYLYMNFRSIVVGAMLEPIKGVIAESNLPQDQKDRLTTIAERLGTDYKEGRISGAEMGEIAEELSEGPFFTLLQLSELRGRYERVCKPTEETLAEAKLAFSRFERGLVEKTISRSEAEEVMGKLFVGDANSDQIRDDLTAEELTALVAELKQAADEAEVPVEPYQVDLASHLEEAIDKVLEPATQPGEAPPSAERTPE